MLRIGLTGGIGAGKSTVSATFAECGGIIVDGDVIAREVVEPGTHGLAQLVDAFGREILHHSGPLAGALNRPALAAIAFSDDGKRSTLNGIVHPLVAHRRSELIAAAIEAETSPIIVEDIPLLVESQMAPMFPMVVIVHADIKTRVARLLEYRDFSEADARARVAAQATDEQRRDVADVWLENLRGPGELREQARALWYERNTACGHRAVRIDHIGSTAVPGMDAKDVIDVQITVDSLDTADELAGALLTAGYPRVGQITADLSKPDARSTVDSFNYSDDVSLWHKRFHASADPGRATNLHLRVEGWPGQQFALLFTDWLKANPAVPTTWRPNAPPKPSAVGISVPTPMPGSPGSLTGTAAPGSGRTRPVGALRPVALRLPAGRRPG